ncbi:MAG: hypothetical protein ACLRWQ_13620 [Flavonifractor plautii]
MLLDNNAEAADGTLGTVEVYANQTISWYEPAEAVPDRLVGRKGALLLDEAGKAVGFLPDDSSHRTLHARPGGGGGRHHRRTGGCVCHLQRNQSAAGRRGQHLRRLLV